MRRARIVSLVIVVVVAGWAVTACRSGGAQPTPSPSLTLSAPSPTASLSPAITAVQDAVATYRNMWAAYDTAVGVPNPNDPNLAKYATGNALQTLVSGLQSLKDKGLKGTGTVTVTPQVTAVSPTQAPTKVSLRDCLDDSDSHVVRATPGAPYSDTPGGKHLTSADVERQGDGSWKVTDFGVRAVGTC